ncbi:apolipoprotein N-acyltransferase [Saccharospirillum sp. MSK14-1]|uniref:apolipoprotein N-acyltransferase n=1 Tax=Saccharospirillum sp. MSK14-1 TaxID=1897632 RepID=UPI000D3961D0|nr:apolipoprotein N-acyltransferase [Saccharospirillum sp. MSK14-1]PTY36990.1 apolipoprotein N-acyltransferase [Saccharospirillum sp. MSK14-1]
MPSAPRFAGNRLSATNPRVLSVLAVLFGLLLPLALAPFYLWPLAWLSIAGYFWVVHQARSSRQAFWLGLCFGAGLFGLGISWVYASMRTVHTGVALSVLMTTAFCLGFALLSALQAWLYHRFLAGRRGALTLGAPALWVMFEWLRSWLFTGMPWLLAGYAHTGTWFGQLSSLVSVYGLSLALALAAAQLTRLVAAGRAARWGMISAVLATLLGFGAGALWPADHWTTASDRIRAVAVQSNIAQTDKWRSDMLRPTLDFYGRQAGLHADVDLMLWPEAALTARPERLSTYLSQLDQLGLDRNQGIVTGIINSEDGRFFNTLLGFGTASGEYRKQHLVPFGEYLPFDAQLRGLINFFSIPMSTMSPAQTPQRTMPWNYAGQTRQLAPVICYEAAYPGLVRQLARDSDLLIMVSNDAWFGDSLAPHQHLQITRMRAIENGRDIVRATQNGISALIDARGRIVQRSAQFEIAAVKGDVQLRQGITPYQRFGGQAWLLLPVLMLVLCRWPAKRTDSV